MRTSFDKVLLVGVALLTVGVRAQRSAEACGPWLAAEPLVDAKGLLESAVEVSFEDELAKLAPGVEPRPRLDRNEVERAQLYAVLRARHASKLTIASVLAWQVIGREAIKQGKPLPPMPAAMPAQFRLYLEAVAASGAERVARARELLALPEGERRERTVWAAYLLWLEHERDRRWDTETRALAARGFPDPLDLAAATRRDQAGQQWLDDPAEAGRMLLAAYRLGHPEGAHNLLVWASSVLDGPPAKLAQVAADDELRQVVTARLLAVPMLYRGPVTEDREKAWLTVLGRAKGRAVRGAELLAGLAYRRGDIVLARAWLAVADPALPLSAWVAAKLALRVGDERTAMLLLKQAMADEPAMGDENRVALSKGWEGWYEMPRPSVELATLRLAHGDAAGALDLYRQGGDWMSSAWVAERVMTVDELRAYVDARVPEPPGDASCRGAGRASDDEPSDPAPRWCMPGELTARQFADWKLRHLLGRALARRGDLALARPYLPPVGRPLLDALTKALAFSQDQARPATERGVALMTAARYTRRFGMELYGTELAPDWTVWDGEYAGDDLAIARTAQRGPGAPGRVELTRLHGAFPLRRYHYRWTASELAWQAAALLPEGSELEAQALCFGGQWIIMSDQPGALRFWVKFAHDSRDTRVFARSTPVFEHCINPGELPVGADR